MSANKVRIPNGTAISAVVPLGSQVLSEIQMPAAWTAANLAFQTSPDNKTFTDLYDDAGNLYVVKADTSRSLAVDASMFKAAVAAKIKSVSAADSSVAVNQGADRDLIVTAKRY